jgi:hypothetical protein
MFTIAIASIAADANQTLTTAQVIGGYIVRPSLTAGRTDTMPSAAAMCEAVQGCAPGLAFKFDYAPTGGTGTLAMGAGGTAGNGTMTCVTTAIKTFLFVFTNCTIGAEAYTVHSLGTNTA